MDKFIKNLKFRGRRIDNNEWFYGYYLRVTKTLEESDGFVSLIVDDYGVQFEVEEDSVGVFTGFYDKTGKEIYSGDIVEFYRISYEEIDVQVPVKIIAPVEYDEYQFQVDGYMLSFFDTNYDISEGNREYETEILEEYIYDNPDSEFKDITGKDLYILKVIGNLTENSDLITKNE